MSGWSLVEQVAAALSDVGRESISPLVGVRRDAGYLYRVELAQEIGTGSWAVPSQPRAALWGWVKLPR